MSDGFGGDVEGLGAERTGGGRVASKVAGAGPLSVDAVGRSAGESVDAASTICPLGTALRLTTPSHR